MRLHIPRLASRPWLVALGAAICAIWGNSLVPGPESGAFSALVASWLNGLFRALGAAGDPVSNLAVRKCAHFLEYAVLAAIAMQAFRPHLHSRRARHANHYVAAVGIVLTGVPAMDETIQLFVPGRVGQISDAALDWCGCLVGLGLVLVCSWLRRRAAGRAGGEGDGCAGDGRDGSDPHQAVEDTAGEKVDVRNPGDGIG